MNKYLVPKKTDIEDIIPILHEKYEIVDPQISYPRDTSINDLYIINSKGKLYGFKVYTFFPEKIPENITYEDSIIKKFSILNLNLPFFILTKGNKIYCKVSNYFAVLSSFVEGDSFNDEEEYYRSAGELLGRIHSLIPTKEKGRSYILTSNGLDSIFEEELTLNELLNAYKINLSRTDFEHMRFVLTHLSDLIRSSNNKLYTFVHGEYDKKALCFNKGKVNGLLDFESSRIDHPFFDLACAYRNFGCINRNILSPNVTEFSIFIKEYKKEFPLAEEIYLDFPFYLKIFLGQLIVSRLYHFWKTGDTISFRNQEQKLIKEIAWVEENNKLFTDLIKK
jgi:Ser/Thr protein kinase RdoA (MazF antagonist)